METDRWKEHKRQVGTKKDHPDSGRGYRGMLRNLGWDRYRGMSQGPKSIQMS